MRSTKAGVRLVALAVALLVPASAHAAFPGANGKINFYSDRSPSGFYFMNPDGSSPASATAGGVWSPDASRVLYQCTGGYFCVKKADGTIEGDGAFGGNLQGLNWSPDGTRIVAGAQYCYADYCDPARVTYTGYPSGPGGTVTTQDDLDPAWSPDGSKIAFVTYRHDPRQLVFTGGPGGCSPCNTELYVSNVDGTGQVRLTNGPGSEGGGDVYLDHDVQDLPSWSPDGTKIAFASTRDDPNPDDCWSTGCEREIYVINADGTGTRRLTNSPGEDTKPVWSPDGTKIAFQTNRDGNREIYSMNTDGSGQTNLTNNPSEDVLYDWLSIPINAYPRPKGASPLQAFLVPAYKPCTTPNRTHGSPLAFPSCAPPTQASSRLTVGTPDANGQGAKSVAKVVYIARPGDLAISAAISDVRNRSDLSDYTGELGLVADLRITDRDNTPNPGGPGPGTVSDTTLPVTAQCSETPDTTVGSDCNLATTVNALYPGAITAGQRSIWQLGQVKAYDGGADGLASTTADNTLFLDQGIFVP